MRALLVGAVVAVLAAPAHAASFRAEERLGTALSAGPIQVVLDPGWPAGDANPRVILPGTTALRAEAVVVDGGGQGVTSARVLALITEQGRSAVAGELSMISPGVYRGPPLAWGGARVTLVVLYDWTGDGSIDRTVGHAYRPAP